MHVLSAERIIDIIRNKLEQATGPYVVAIDGGSGAGKSTIAHAVADRLDGVVIPCDDFFSVHVTDLEWNKMPANARADSCLNWRRLKAEALIPLKEGRPAKWKALDFESGQQADGTYSLKDSFEVAEPKRLIVLEGAFASRAELRDEIDFAVLVDVPAPVRHARLRSREAPEVLEYWHARWDEAEELYLAQLQADLVVSNL